MFPAVGCSEYALINSQHKEEDRIGHFRIENSFEQTFRIACDRLYRRIIMAFTMAEFIII